MYVRQRVDGVKCNVAVAVAVAVAVHVRHIV